MTNEDDTFRALQRVSYKDMSELYWIWSSDHWDEQHFMRLRLKFFRDHGWEYYDWFLNEM